MNTFDIAPATKPDPLKRLNYPFGLVMGVDEFVQEQTYLLELARGHQRSLHGYGTLWGLLVRVPRDVEPAEVRISPGVAVAPAGMRICVPRTMCARLDQWLEAHLSGLRTLFGDPPFTLSLCVILCYRECRTDIVPLPGEPCRSEDEATAPSRIADSFELKLCLHDDDQSSLPLDARLATSLPQDAEGIEFCNCPQPSAESEGTRAFAALLRQIEVDPAGPYITAAELEDAVRAIAAASAADGSFPDSLPDPPPVSQPQPLLVPPEELRALLQAAARVWVTEVLPELLRRDGRNACCVGGSDGGDCVPLARLRVPVGPGGTIGGGASEIIVDESARPVLLSTRVMQEWLIAGGPVDRI